MPTELTMHAAERIQQRAIPPLVIDLLYRCGSSMRCGFGLERLFFDKPARKRLKAMLGGARGLRTIERWLDVYLVLSDNGSIVTVGHQFTRFRRP